MDTTTSPVIEDRVEEEIRRLVAEATVVGTTISTAECVAKIKSVYPTCGFSRRELTDKVIAAATAAGMVVEIGSEADLNALGS